MSQRYLTTEDQKLGPELVRNQDFTKRGRKNVLKNVNCIWQV